jgi:hypothetical protein
MYLTATLAQKLHCTCMLELQFGWGAVNEASAALMGFILKPLPSKGYVKILRGQTSLLTLLTLL